MAKGNIRKTWLTIKNIINGPYPSARNPINEIKIDNNKVIDPVSIANEFNKFFVNIGPKLANQISQENGDIRLSKKFFLKKYGCYSHRPN